MHQSDPIHTFLSKSTRFFFNTSMVLVVTAALLTGCLPSTTSPTNSGTNSENARESSSSSNEAGQSGYRVGDTTKTGLISTAGSGFFITEPGGAPQPIDSYAVELINYVGQTATITGQYSGDTLFVGVIE